MKLIAQDVIPDPRLTCKLLNDLPCYCTLEISRVAAGNNITIFITTSNLCLKIK